MFIGHLDRKIMQLFQKSEPKKMFPHHHCTNKEKIKRRRPNRGGTRGVHTFVNKKGLWCRMNVIQSAFYSSNLGEHFKYLLYGNSTLRKFFSAVRSSETPSKSHFSSLFPSSQAAFSDHQNTKIDQLSRLRQ